MLLCIDQLSRQNEEKNRTKAYAFRQIYHASNPLEGARGPTRQLPIIRRYVHFLFNCARVVTGFRLLLR